jgi:hypothetical protein
MLLRRPRHSAEAHERLAARLFRLHARAEILLDGGVDVGSNLGVEIGIEGLAAKGR